MKAHLFSPMKSILADRPIVALVSIFVIFCIAYCLYVSFSLQPSDLQVAVRYTSFGETGFYREKWGYLISFIFFGLSLLIIHTALIMKLYLQGRRQMTFSFAWLSILVLLIAWFITHSVLKVAFL